MPYFQLKDNFRLHYVDEGQGEPILMLHGNPTWSFMYRKLIADAVSRGYRAIAPDHIGCGLSDKPQDYHYTLDNHIQNLTQLIKSLDISNITLVMHDWGGPIGMGYALRHPDKIKRIVLMNTVAFLSRDFPKRIYLCRIPLLAPLLVRGANLLIRTALKRGTVHPLPKDVLEKYSSPYSNWHDRVAVLAFPQDIPLSPKHPSYNTLKYIGDNLHTLKDKPITLIWGTQDFCIHTGFLNTWQKIYPDATVHLLDNAAHFLLEDAPEQVINYILSKNDC